MESEIGKAKQIMRLAAGAASVFASVYFIGTYIFQCGVTKCQRAIREDFPEEYAAITEKIINLVKK